jgi:hypothetical protein
MIREQGIVKSGTSEQSAGRKVTHHISAAFPQRQESRGTMKTEGSTFDKTMRNAGFSALVCTTFGFLMLETCLIRLAARPVVHLTGMVIGTTLVVLIYRGMIGYWRVLAASTLETNRAEDESLFSTSHLTSALLLVGIGYLGAKTLGSGWATASGLYVIFLLLFPWSKVPLCRRSVAASWSVISLAVIAALLTAGQQPHPLLLSIVVWILWIAAAWTWLRLILLRKRKSKASGAPHLVEDTAVVSRN